MPNPRPAYEGKITLKKLNKKNEVNSKANKVMKGETEKESVKKSSQKQFESTQDNSINPRLEIRDRDNPIKSKAKKLMKLKAQ
jgi:hypothetical protein